MAKLHDLKVGESIEIDLTTGDQLELQGGKVKIQLLHKKGQRARIAISADNAIPVRVLDSGG